MKATGKYKVAPCLLFLAYPKVPGSRAEHEVQAAPQSGRKIAQGAKLCRVSQGLKWGVYAYANPSMPIRHVSTTTLDLVDWNWFQKPECLLYR